MPRSACHAPSPRLTGLQVRSFAKEGTACERYSTAQGDCLRWGLKTAKLEGFFFAFSGFLAYSAVMSVLWFGARKVRAV